jgi:hypothetical protein
MFVYKYSMHEKIFYLIKISSNRTSTDFMKIPSLGHLKYSLALFLVVVTQGEIDKALKVSGIPEH